MPKKPTIRRRATAEGQELVNCMVGGLKLALEVFGRKRIGYGTRTRAVFAAGRDYHERLKHPGDEPTGAEWVVLKSSGPCRP
jgi:hypothetical protein